MRSAVLKFLAEELHLTGRVRLPRAPTALMPDIGAAPPFNTIDGMTLKQLRTGIV